MTAISDAYKAGLFKRQHWIPNIISGSIVGVVALPLAMAFAIASGAKPEQGIYTAIVAGLIVSAFGGSRFQIAGPTGAFIVILSGITNRYGISGLQIATMMAGIILLLLGFAKMGSIIKFIPDPVIVGFTSGIGVIIWVGQWRYFFGLPAVTGEHFHEKLWLTLHSFGHLHLPTTALALLSLLIVIAIPKLPGLTRVPGPLVAVVAATILQAAFHFHGIATIGTAFGGIPQGFPAFQAPPINAQRIIELIGPAFTIAMLGAIESLLSAVVADGMGGTRHNSNKELVGQGIANIVVPFFGGFAATGAIARTATNIRNGGTGPLSGMVHSLTLILIILFLAPMAVNIPLATLAAILFVVAWNMSEIKHFTKMLRRAPRADIAILLVTFGLTIFADLVIAVNIGVILAILQFLRRMVSSVEIREVTQQEMSQAYSERAAGKLPSGVLAFSIEGPFFFGAVENLDWALASTHTDPKILILRLGWVPFMDITGIQALEYAVQDLHKRKVRVMLAGANERVAIKLRNAGILDLVGDENCFEDFGQALAACQSPSVSAP